MPDNQTAAAIATTADGTEVTGRVALIEMIVWTETEAERLETWARLTVDPQARMWLARRAHIARMTVRTLDLVRDNEKEFVEIIRNKSEVGKRKERKK